MTLNVNHFAVAGNTRVGSTWLNSALNTLPGIYTTREIRWRFPYMEDAPAIHVYIDPGATTSLKERLEFGLPEKHLHGTTTVGSKLKFDPFGFLHPRACDHLRAITENDVSIIHLRRPYFEIFQTWKSIGIRHLANPDRRARGNRYEKMHGIPVERRPVIITTDGHLPLAERLSRGRSNAGEVVYNEIGNAIDNMMVLFCNDLQILSIFRSHPRIMFCEYRDIRENFPALVRHVLPGFSAETYTYALDNAATLPLEIPGTDYVAPARALKAISACLDETFCKVRSGALAVEDVIRFEEPGVRFILPDLDAILAGHEETRTLSAARPPGFLVRARRLLLHEKVPRRTSGRLTQNTGDGWRSNQPVYMPVTPPLHPYFTMDDKPRVGVRRSPEL